MVSIFKFARILSSCAVIAWALSPALALAYVPPSAFIMKSIVKKHQGIKSVRIRSVLATPTNSVRIKITTYVLYPEQMLISWASDEQDHELMRVVRSSGELSPVDALFFDSNFTSLENSLKTAGIPIKTEADLIALSPAPAPRPSSSPGVDPGVESARRHAEIESLKRWRSKVAWVIGGDDSPQLWVEKDSFLPLRLVFNSASGRRFEMQADEYRFYKDFAYPKNWILMFAGRGDGSYLFKQDLSDIQTNLDPKSPEYRSLESTPSRVTDAGNAAPADVRDLLEMYYGESYGRNR